MTNHRNAIFGNFQYEHLLDGMQAFAYQKFEWPTILRIPFEINKCLQCRYSKQAK